jgi:23S rRNA pseudouridine2605 synthase
MTRRSKKLFRQGPPPQRRPTSKPPRGPGANRDEGDDAGGIRLQKVMASAGVGSRRHCEELILAGRVTIDGRTVKKLGTRVEPTEHEVRVDGELLKTARTPVYYLVNKPDGVVSTNYDQAGRTRVVDLVPQHEHEHLYTVGRLDLSSEGLILVTNDGELANRLTHPRYGVEKTYLALVAGQMPQEEIDKLREGVHLAEGVARCVSVYVRKALPQSTLVEIVLAEGKNREIRRILAKVGHKVLTLKRVAIGKVKLRDLKSGAFRRPTREELKSLREAQPHRPRRPARRPTASVAARSAPETTDVTPIIDTRDRSNAGKPKRFDRRKPRREPGTGTIIGE